MDHVLIILDCIIRVFRKNRNKMYQQNTTRYEKDNIPFTCGDHIKNYNNIAILT